MKVAFAEKLSFEEIRALLSIILRLPQAHCQAVRLARNITRFGRSLLPAAKRADGLRVSFDFK